MAGRRLRLAIVLLITAACLLWFLWGINLDAVAVSLAGVRWHLVLLGVTGYLGTHVFRTVRLGQLIERPVPLRALFSVTCIGYLAINVVPLRLGELVRPYLLADKHGVPFGGAMAAIFVERLLDMLCLVGMLLLVAWVVDLPPGGIVVGDVDVVNAGQAAAGLVVGAGALAMVAVVAAGERFVGLVERLSGRVPALGARLPAFIRGFQTELRVLARTPRRGLAVVATSIASWLTTIGGVWITLRAFDGLPRGWDAALTTWSVTLAGLTMAPTPGFFGSFEAFCTASLMLWQVDADVARTFAVVLHLAILSFIVAIGLLYLVREGLSLRQVVRASQAVPER